MSKDKAPREFWVWEDENHRILPAVCYDPAEAGNVLNGFSEKPFGKITHVIDYASYAALESKLAECVAALEFYGDKTNCDAITEHMGVKITAVGIDGGRRARDVLAKVKK